VDGRRPRFGLGLLLVCLVLFRALYVLAAAPAAAPAATSSEQDPEGVAFNAATSTYSLHRVPKRSLDAVMKSIEGWQHQVLADGSTANYSAEDGILSMDCSACGLSRPSAIDIGTIDLGSMVAYEAGPWHIGIRSKDGTQDFFGVLRGEIGPEPHDPARVNDDRRVALAALADLYDLAYLTQNPPNPQAPAKGEQSPPAVRSTEVPKPTPTPTAAAPTSLATLAASGDVEAVQAQQRGKANARDVARALEIAYGVRARTQMLDGKMDAALQTLSAGRQGFGKSTPLRDREAHYVVIGDAYDRLRLAVKLDVTELRGYLERIRSLESADAGAIEQMLVQTLSNRIADQRAAGRATVADDLLKSGRELFPVAADQLTRGKSGALPEEGVQMGTEAPDHNSAR
jgi:hypothetical protein